MASESNQEYQEQGISIKEALLRLGRFIQFLFSKWKSIVIGSLIITSLYVSYQLITPRKYSAQTTFVLDVKGGAGSVSSLASVVGINLGSLAGSENELFSAENILQLYGSYRMLKKTFLKEVDLHGKNQRLITHYASNKDLLEYWRSDDELTDFSFEVPLTEMTVKHDSLLMIVVDEFRKKQLLAEKMSRKLSIMKVLVEDKDEKWAKAFNEELVKNVNRFYLETKTRKSLEDLLILQHQADSVKEILDEALSLYTLSNQNAPYANPLKSSTILDTRKLQVDLQIASAVYEEVMKQLAIARITHQKNTPLIQILDRPILPLDHDKSRKLVILIKGGFLGGFLMIGFFTFRRIYELIMSEEA